MGYKFAEYKYLIGQLCYFFEHGISCHGKIVSINGGNDDVKIMLSKCIVYIHRTDEIYFHQEYEPSIPESSLLDIRLFDNTSDWMHKVVAYIFSGN